MARGLHNQRREKAVRLAVFDNEPMARLAEQRLRQLGIPCFTRSLRGGPGLWGSSYNLPHDLYVNESDQARASDVLNLAEPVESEDRFPHTRATLALWLAAAIIVATLAIGIVVPLLLGTAE